MDHYYGECDASPEQLANTVYVLGKQQRVSKPPCAWCGSRGRYAAEMVVYESDVTQRSYLFCTHSCKHAFIKDANYYTGD